MGALSSLLYGIFAVAASRLHQNCSSCRNDTLIPLRRHGCLEKHAKRRRVFEGGTKSTTSSSSPAAGTSSSCIVVWEEYMPSFCGTHFIVHHFVVCACATNVFGKDDGKSLVPFFSFVLFFGSYSWTSIASFSIYSSSSSSSSLSCSCMVFISRTTLLSALVYSMGHSSSSS